MLLRVAQRIGVDRIPREVGGNLSDYLKQNYPQPQEVEAAG